jgi:hypothetical protein
MAARLEGVLNLGSYQKATGAEIVMKIGTVKDSDQILSPYQLLGKWDAKVFDLETNNSSKY